jgi:hypothetical protein
MLRASTNDKTNRAARAGRRANSIAAVLALTLLVGIGGAALAPSAQAAPANPVAAAKATTPPKAVTTAPKASATPTAPVTPSKSTASKAPTAPTASKAPTAPTTGKLAVVAAPNVAAATSPATTTTTNAAIDCNSDTILVMDQTNIFKLDTSTMVSTLLTPLDTTWGNAVAINYDGTKVFFVDVTGSKIETYDVTTATFTNGPAASNTTLAGAVNPVNGKYYYSSSAGSVLNVYDPTTNTASEVGPEVGGTSQNGDLAFDKQGNGYYLGDSNLWRFTPKAGADGKVVFTLLATGGFPFGSDGIAFGGDGYLYTTNKATPGQIQKVNPVNGAIISTTIASGADAQAVNFDAGSCSSQPGTVSLKKNLPDGRAVAGDQFSLTIASTGIVGGNTATTTGSASGVQSALAGPVIGLPNTQYTISEKAASGTLDRYTATWSCVNASNGGASVASGSGSSGTFAFPKAISAGENVVCTFTNVAIPAAVQAAETPQLAFTGSDTGPELLIAALALVIGGALSLAARRR